MNASAALHVSPDAQIVIRSDSVRPFYIARRQRAYTAAELTTYLTVLFPDAPRSSTRVLALMPESKTKGFGNPNFDTVVAYAKSRGIAVVVLEAEGNAIDGLLFGDALSKIGAPSHEGVPDKRRAQ